MKSTINKIFTSKIWLPLTIVLLVAFNWVGSKFHTRIDFTDERRFTLSSSTESILKNLDSTVDITVLLTGDIKSEFKKLSNNSLVLLDSFLNSDFISPVNR